MESDGPGASAPGGAASESLDSVKTVSEGAAATSPVPRFQMAGSTPAQVAYLLTRQALPAAPPAVPAIQVALPLGATPPQATPPGAANPLHLLARPSLPLLEMRPRPTPPAQSATPTGGTWFDAVRARVDAINAGTGAARSTIDITAGDARVVRAAPLPRLKQRVTLDLLAEKCDAVSTGRLKWKAFDEFLGLARDRVERVRLRLLGRRQTRSSNGRAEVGTALKSLGDAVGLMQQAAGKQDGALLEAALRAAAESDDMLERARASMAMPSSQPGAPSAASSRVA